MTLPTRGRPEPNLLVSREGGNSRRLEVELEEYRVLRAELLTRIQKQQEITGFAIALLAATIAISQLFGDTQPFSETISEMLPVLPVISIVLSAFALVTLEYELNIAHIYKYIDLVLRRRIEALLESDADSPGLLGWNEHRAFWQQHVGWRSALTATMAGAKYAATIVPNVLILGLYVRNRARPAVISWHGALFLAAIFVLCLVVACAVHTSHLYLTMPTPANPGDT